MPDHIPVNRALLSVSDKRGLLDFAHGLVDLGIELVSTGGTARALAESGLAVTPVENLTGMPEMLEGRVKTLHPAIHAALLARRDHDEDLANLARLGIEPIDLVCVNLYPFERTIATPGVDLATAIEQIDIGGPAMIRAAAKNHSHVVVLTRPDQYPRVLSELRDHDRSTSALLRAELARAAFERTAGYDDAISRYLRSSSQGPEPRPAPANPSGPARAMPERLNIRAELVTPLRYGENPHQPASLYRTPGLDGGSLVDAELLRGKPPSYNNYADADAALSLVRRLLALPGVQHAACVVKHSNPCGAATASSLAEAVGAALAGDPLAAFGGIVACSSPVDDASAARLASDAGFIEVIVSPGFSPDAADRLGSRWANIRLLDLGAPIAPTPSDDLVLRTVWGGLLAEHSDTSPADSSAWRHAAGPAPTPELLETAAVIEAIAASLTSNAIAIGGRTDRGAVAQFGAGAGQMDRLAACRLAVDKAGQRAHGAIAASDAFFPFPDGPELLIDAGIAAIVHPGGSKRDSETFSLCDRAGVTCLTTGIRRFRH